MGGRFLNPDLFVEARHLLAERLLWFEQ